MSCWLTLSVAARRYPSLWVHVDAAWAGVAYALPEYRETGHLASLNSYVDSFSTNMHKWGLVPFDCAPLWVRNRGAVSGKESSFSVSPPDILVAAEQCSDNHARVPANEAWRRRCVEMVWRDGPEQ